MTRRIGFWTMLGLWTATFLLPPNGALGQSQPWQGPPAGPRPPAAQYGPPVQPVEPVRTVAPGRAGQPEQPGNLQYPPGAPRPAVQQGPQVPFVLNREEEALLDRWLATWEQKGKGVRNLKVDFTRWKYDSVFSDPREPQKPRSSDKGILMYDMPDKGLFEVTTEGKEKWICDGKSVFQYDYGKKALTEYKLPPEMQGKAITNGPLPFLFGSEAQRLKQRYYLRVITPRDAQGQLWLEAFPRYQADAANFAKAELILTVKDMTPFAMQIYAPGGKERTVYQFENVVLNDPVRWTKGNPYAPSLPWGGWRKLVEEPPAATQAQRVAPGRR